MSDEEKSNKHFDNDPERTLITLEQLSQTIEVMTTVVNRLRQHLSEQLKAQIDEKYQNTAADAQSLRKNYSKENESNTQKERKNLILQEWEKERKILILQEWEKEKKILI